MRAQGRAHGRDEDWLGAPLDELTESDVGGLFAMGDKWIRPGGQVHGEDGEWIHTPDGETVFRVRTLSADGTPSVGTEPGAADAGHDGNGADQPGVAGLMASARGEGTGLQDEDGQGAPR